ncbi:MAG TPA: DUF1611 domain-containing protein [Candidatus Limnocylindria bacterium]|nr:DUF1611 domain-containing protein [Candidatus Limnocylindria bacterium]
MLDRLLSDSPNESAESMSPDAVRLRRAAWASTTRRVRGTLSLVEGTWTPKPGDLLLARVDQIGFHSALQLPDGRRKRLFLGDEIVVAYGNRYAPNQFEAVVPKTLGPCQLVASGGVAGKVLSWHASLAKQPTQITPVALLVGPSGKPANLKDYALPFFDHVPAHRPTIAVAGTSMDSGKTQTAAFLVKGLTLAGLRVGFAKITGTGSGGDTWLLKDAGANPVLDFTDAGLASTYLVSQAEVQRVFVTLTAHLIESKVDAIVLEIADGVLQGETAALLKTKVFKEVVGGIVFTASDAMGALAGESWLRDNGLPLVALSGILTASPLSTKEASKATRVPIFSRQDLARSKTAMGILASAQRRTQPATSPAKAPRGEDGSESKNGDGRQPSELGNGSERPISASEGLR